MSAVHTRFHLDPSNDGKLTIQRVQDVESILEHNKVLRSMPQKSDWGRHIASIPNIIIEKWLNEAWQSGNTTLKPFTKEFDELTAKKLRDPDWKFLRTDK